MIDFLIFSIWAKDNSWNDFFEKLIEEQDFSIFYMEDFFLFVFLLPLFTLFIVSFFSSIQFKYTYEFSLFSSLFSFFLSIILWFLMEESKGGFEFSYLLGIFPQSKAFLRLGVDGISIFFVILTNLFIYLSIFFLNSKFPKLNDLLFYLFFLQWSVLGSFLFLDFLGFFIFFEITLLPIFFIILEWGSRERRVRASYMISIYTLLGSIFMFFNIIYLYSKVGTTDYEMLLTLFFNEWDQKFLWLTFFFAFAAKIPVFPLHIWLPEAHVEAPTLGSVILAVLLLKLGTYGIIRFLIPIFPDATKYYAPFVSVFAILGIIYTCFTAIRQIDLKKIIAYSSVSHMNLVLIGILILNLEALQGAIFQMLSHGIISGALFFSVGILYERYGVRSLNYFGGLVYFYPLFSLVFLIFSFANISFPLTSSFVGEFLILMGIFFQNFWLTFFASTSMVLGAVYTLWTYNRLFFGNIKEASLSSYKDLTKKEFMLFFILIIFLFLMGIYSYLFLQTMIFDCLNLLEHAEVLA